MRGSTIRAATICPLGSPATETNEPPSIAVNCLPVGNDTASASPVVRMMTLSALSLSWLGGAGCQEPDNACAPAGAGASRVSDAVLLTVWPSAESFDVKL